VQPRFWPALGPYVGLVVGYFASPAEATADFYAAAAQIIPVLLLVLAVELRFFRVRAEDLPSTRYVTARNLARTLRSLPESAAAIADDVDRAEQDAVASAVGRLVRTVIAVTTLLSLTVGQFTALHPLAQGDADAGNPRWVYMAIGSGLGAIATLALLGDDAEPAPDG
jgi:hypothetical protein